MTDPTPIKANFDEAKQSQLPFVEMLVNLGYEYLPREQALKERENDTSKFLLREIAFQKLKEINSYEHKGKTYKFEDSLVYNAIDELENTQLEGLIDTSKTIYQAVMPKTGGKSIKVFHGGKGISKDFRFIDFDNPHNNSFHVTVEFETTGKQTVRTDIVCFVNGIPFVVIENKKSSEEIDQAINQLIRNQGKEYCPKFFIFPQLFVATNKEELKYGTAGTPNKFYAAWKEKDISKKEQNEKISQLIKQKIRGEVYAQILFDLHGAVKGHTQVVKRSVTEQDRGVYYLLQKDRLLHICKNAILYDAGEKKVLRYQQFFAIEKMLDRVLSGKKNEPREGGLLWHTQGSGKSLTMVMFVRALTDHPDIENPRIIIVTDRKDLDKQIGTTFKNCNLKKSVIKAKNGRHLLNLIKDKELNVVTTLVHKFKTAAKFRGDFVDESRDIFVLVDEAHRTQGGMANLEMNKTIPNACYIGFTGTPLMKKDKESWKKFGGYIDKYTIDDARRDEIILPLNYEGRYVDLELNQKQVDRQVDRILADLSAKQKKELQKDVDKNIIKNNPQRIVEIAIDVLEHYHKEFKYTGLKAQLVAPSKFSAVLFQKFFEAQPDIRTAIVISDESHIVDEEDAHKKEVLDYLDEITHKYRSLKSYEDDVINSFKYDEEGVEMLIVVDKLLTGFDAPRNTVLYLAKDLKDHNLLQAIARVNRLFDNPRLPKTSGYIIDYSENAKNLDSAMKLFGNFDEDDVKGALVDVDEKISELKQSYGDLHDHFKELSGSKDDSAYIQILENEPKRKLFYEDLNKFIRVFNECLVLREFPKKFSDVDMYALELKKFLQIKKSANTKYADRSDMQKYKLALRNILDKYVDANGVELLTQQIDITDRDKFAAAVDSLGSDKSKAEAIAAQTAKIINERFNADPKFYEKFSDRIKELLKKMKDNKLADAEVLGQMKLIRDAVIEKKDEGMPEKITAQKGADIFYRNLKGSFKKVDDLVYQKLILDLLAVVKKHAIVDWYKNAEVKRIMANKLDDFLYDESHQNKEINLTDAQMREIVNKTIDLANNNYEII